MGTRRGEDPVRAPHDRVRQLLAVVLVAVGLGVLAVVGVRLLPTPVPAVASWVPPPPLTGSALAQAPTRLRIPSIGVDTSLELLDLDSTGALVAPHDFAEAGWYVGGPAPGDPGPAVLAGHVDSTTGPAVFYKLHALRSGDQVQVLRAGEWLTFHVVDTQKYAKDAFPAARVYGPTPGAELRLITCGGSFNRSAHSYVDNIVVYAIAG